MVNSTKHLQRIFPLYARAEVLTTTFSILIHFLKNNDAPIMLSEVKTGVMGFKLY